MLYFYPLGMRVSKAAPQSWRHAGWSTPYGDWWCCMGTGVEAFARLAENVFMQSPRPSHARRAADTTVPGDHVPAGRTSVRPADPLDRSGVQDSESARGREEDGEATVAPTVPELFVMQLVPTSILWRSAGLRLRLALCYA